MDNVLLDTGSAGSIFSADKLAEIGLFLQPDDELHQIYGVGGSEFVFVKQIEKLLLGELMVSDFTVELGALGYGFELDGIIGTDFFQQTSAQIDFSSFDVR